jgi:hypothetical protein
MENSEKVYAVYYAYEYTGAKAIRAIIKEEEDDSSDTPSRDN